MASLSVFLVSRLVGLERFPIFFFCDEAVQTLRASDLLRRGFRGESGELLPTYFRNGESFNLSVGVYAQVLPTLVFGRSVFVTRATQVFVLLTAMAAVGLMLRDAFRLRFWWAGVLVLSVLPGWFLHTRLAFELMLATAFYVWFLYFYLQYRGGRTLRLFPALLFGALTFYGYNTFQPVIILTALLLLVADAPYHWHHRRVVALGLLFLAGLALPYLRFFLHHRDEIQKHLILVESYWTAPELSVSEKLGRYGKEYARGFSPAYWCDWRTPLDIDRHRMKGYGHIPWAAIPFVVGGLVLCLRRIRDPANRTLLIAFLAAPAGAALLVVGITRAMTFIVATALLATLAIEEILIRLPGRSAVVGVLVFVLFGGLQVWILLDSLHNGPLWYRDYGLYGLQYGARQVFGDVKRLLRREPQLHISISPIWTNGTGDLAHFFLGEERRVIMADLSFYTYTPRSVGPRVLEVLTADEYKRACADPKIAVERVDSMLPYPDGRPGFYFVRLAYTPGAPAIFAAEAEQRRRPVVESAVVQGETVRLTHSRFAVGRVEDLFDGKTWTLVKILEANPAIFEFEFERPRTLRGVTLTTGSMDMEVTLDGFAGFAPLVRTFRDLPPDPTVRLDFEKERRTQHLLIAIRDLREGEQIHVREIGLR